MKKTWKKLFTGAVSAAALFAMMPAMQAFGQDLQTSRDEIRRYQSQVERMQTVDTSKYKAEMQQIEVWLRQAESQIAEKDAQGAHNTALRIGVYLEYVDTAMARDIVIGDAEKEEIKLRALRADYGKLEAEVQQLQAEQDKLNQKLESLTQAK
jgi:chromosome segregation ATPase